LVLLVQPQLQIVAYKNFVLASIFCHRFKRRALFLSL